MISILKRNNWFIVKTIVFISVIIPVGITSYETVILQKNSVVFLADYPTAVGITVAIYYALLLIAGIIWVLMQLKSLMTLKNEKTKNELLHLQSQVNPHFFFNMLNNLYGMVDKDAEKSKKLILKLSDLMRYSIYEGEKSLVPLEEEVVYLKNYIELHQMRYHKSIDIQFNSNIEDKTIKVMPLLFITLLENAFKHGVENLRKDAYVHINLTSKNKNIFFEIENNFDESALPKKSGIGIKNLKRRLELAYSKNHTLIFTNIDSIYNVQLQLQHD
ncbi:MAG: histidine kinase [Lutibacter sp.]|nr:MAG: histidine kinase [Lutibacter sp.]